MADEHVPTEEEIREALARVGVADVLVDALTAAISLGYHRLSPEALDLDQTRLAIESVRALEPVLRENGVPAELVRDLEQARANLQLAYASAVAQASDRTAEPGPGPEAEPDVPEDQGAEPGQPDVPPGDIADAASS